MKPFVYEGAVCRVNEKNPHVEVGEVGRIWRLNENGTAEIVHLVMIDYPEPKAIIGHTQFPSITMLDLQWMSRWYPCTEDMYPIKKTEDQS